MDLAHTSPHAHPISHREIAAAIVIDTRGRFLLQQRDDITGILHPGKIGLFGGHCETQETYLECIVREIGEELSYAVSAKSFEHFLHVDGADFDLEGGTVCGDFFILQNIPADGIVVTEGALLIVPLEDFFEIQSKLMPSARFVMKMFFDRQFTAK